jgi:hypothetical protein
MFTCTLWGRNIYILKHLILYLSIIAPDVGFLYVACNFVIKNEKTEFWKLDHLLSSGAPMTKNCLFCWTQLPIISPDDGI